MSRLGKKPIIVPDKTEIKIDASNINVKGPLGELSFPVHAGIKVQQTDGQITVSRTTDSPSERALQGLTVRYIQNMLQGVTQGYKKELELIGVGYKVGLKGQDLEMFLGFSHPVIFKTPTGIKIQVEKNNITISGIDKQLVGETAAKIRSLKQPEPYKGKGIKYIDEVIRRKSGKMAASASE
jgi:large subunit ribosomal protein L6